MTRNGYIFANVADIEIGGTVLPQHEANGAWRPERAEDWAFLAEAWGERSMIEYMDSYTARTQAEIAAKTAELRAESIMSNLRVADAGAVWSLFVKLKQMLRANRWKWCAGGPTESVWDEDGAGTAWETRCPEMFPKRQLNVGITPQTEDLRWEKAHLGEAFAELAGNQKYICDYWYESSTQTSTETDSYGNVRRWPGYGADYWRIGGAEWGVTVPDKPTLTLPQGAGKAMLAALFHAQAEGGRVDRWYVKTVEPDGITAAMLQGMAPQPEENELVTVSLEDKLLIVPISMRTSLN